MKAADKLVSLDDLGKLSHARAGKTLVFTNGCFDILHPGHMHLLASAKNMGSVLLVGLNSDDSVSRIKGPSRPLNKQDYRIEKLAEIDAVDYVIVFDEDTPERLIREIRPEILVKGSDYKETDIVGHDVVKSYGGKVMRVQLLKGHSTSNLIDKMKKK